MLRKSNFLCGLCLPVPVGRAFILCALRGKRLAGWKRWTKSNKRSPDTSRGENQQTKFLILGLRISILMILQINVI